jgi:hypothetical protein
MPPVVVKVNTSASKSSVSVDGERLWRSSFGSGCREGEQRACGKERASQFLDH